MAMLSDDEKRKYHESGFVVPRWRLSEEKLSCLRDALDQVLRDNPDTRPEQLVSVHIGNQKVGQNAEGITGHQAFFDVATDSDILDIVEQLIGRDLILWGCQSFCKPAGDGMEVPWHQDGNYWPINPLATCTVWIAIDDSVAENGCLRVIPGSQREQKLFAHAKEDRDDIVLNQRVCEGEFQAADAEDIELEAGQMSLHDVYMIHGSNPNHSDRRRAGLAIRYMPTTSHFDRSGNSNGTNAGYKVDFLTRPIWLVRGLDQSEKNEFTSLP